MIRHEHWSVGEHPSLDVGVPVGTVEVRTGDAGAVHLSLESAVADDFELSAVGDHITVRHPSRWSLRGRSCRLVVTVPSGTDVTIDSASAEVRLAGSLGSVRVRTASGDIEIDASRRCEVTTASGDISCGTVDGDATITSISGDCSVRGVGGRMEATLTSGDLRVDHCAGDLAVVSTSGSARIGHCGGAEVSLRSLSGDVRVGLPSGIRVDADISTLSGKATLPPPAPTGQPLATDRRPVRLRLKTVSGDIRVERSS
ncbi:MAG: DUF4097 family beta strand repeat-containing protein [Actinomycetota bacterium]|nr:DUF4097 family beta strand repeat-containing protein [Actinomycetota bacterium]